MGEAPSSLILWKVVFMGATQPIVSKPNPNGTTKGMGIVLNQKGTGIFLNQKGMCFLVVNPKGDGYFLNQKGMGIFHFFAWRQSKPREE